MKRNSTLIRRVASVVASLAIAVTLFSPAPVRAAGDAVQTIAFEPIEDQLLSDGSLEISAIADPSGLTVAFTTESAACAVVGTEVEFVAFGDCTITASQAGDTNYAAADPVDQTFEIVSGNNVITFDPLDDLTWGHYYQVDGVGGAFEVSAISDGDDLDFAVEDESVCTIDADGTIGFIHSAGECVITASDSGGEYFDAALNVTQTFRIERGAITLVPRLSDNTYDTEVDDSVSVHDLFQTGPNGIRLKWPEYVGSDKPNLVIDASAGLYFFGEYGPGTLDECDDHDIDDDASSATVDMDHGGVCFVHVRVQRDDNWHKASQQTTNVVVNKLQRSIVMTDYGVTTGESGGALTQTLTPGSWKYFQVRAHASHGTDGVDYDESSPECDLWSEDLTSGRYYTNSDSLNAKCTVTMDLPETQDYLEAPTRYLTAHFSKAASKVVFDKINDMTFPTGQIENAKGNEVHGIPQSEDRRFDINAWVRSLSNGAVRTNERWGGIYHRARLESLTPLVCEIIGSNVPDATRLRDDGGYRPGSMDRSTGVMLLPGKCIIRARTYQGEAVAQAAPVTRTFMINKIPNAITFPSLPSAGIGTEIEFNTGGLDDYSVTSTYFRVGLTESSGTCNFTGDHMVGYTLHLTGLGTCKVTAARTGTQWVAAARSVSRTFTITKAAGQIVLGVDLNENTHFGEMYLPGDPCLSGLPGGCFMGEGLVERHYNPASNRSFDLSNVTNSSGTVTYSKVSGECVVDNGTDKVTITGRNNAGTCVIAASVPSTVGHTAASDQYTINVAKADATIGIFTNPGALTLGTDKTLVGSSFLADMGPVVFSTADGSVCTIVATNKLHPVAEGSCTVYADIVANNAYNAAPQRSYTVSVSKALQTITFNPTAQRTYPSGSGSSLNKLTVSATSTSALTVTVTVVSGPCSMSSAFVVLFTGVGDCILSANQAGNPTYAAATEVQRTIVVSKLPVAVTAPTVSISPLRYGQTATRTQGDWTGSGGVLSYTTAWYRCTGNTANTPTTASVSGCTAIGASASSYLTTSSDLNKYLRVRITVSNFSGTSYRWSLPTGKILAP